jgi:hypothetical protein
MAFLIVGGITVEVATDGVSESRPQLGEVVRAFDGSPRSSVRGKVREWQIRTIPLPAASVTSLLAVLEGAHPIVCSGDLLGGSVSCTPTDIETSPIHLGTARRRSVSFRLLAPP